MKLILNDSNEICLNFLSTLDEFDITSSDCDDNNFLCEVELNNYWFNRGNNEQDI